MVELTPGELAFVGALLRLPGDVKARRERLGTDTTKNHRRALAALRKCHPDHAGLWAREFTLRARPTWTPDHGTRAALAFLRWAWGEPITLTIDPGSGKPTDPFFIWASTACRKADKSEYRSPRGLWHHYRNLSSSSL